MRTDQQVKPGRVSIAIPTFNRSAMLERAIRSALEQDYEDIEIVVSDDASKDDTEARVRAISDSRVTYVRQTKNLGMTPNFNFVLGMATGEFLVPLNDDDVLCPNAIAQLVAPFLNGSQGIPSEQIGLTWCPCTVINASGEELWSTEPGPPVERSLRLMIELYSGRRGPRMSSTMIRTDDCRKVGGYNEALFGAVCDTGNWGDVALRYPYAVCIQQPLVKYTNHGASVTASSACADWQRWGNNMLDTHIATARSMGDAEGAEQLASVRNTLLANLTVDVLLRGKGNSGWVRTVAKEVWRSRQILISRYVATRVVRDGWKLLK